MPTSLTSLFSTLLTSEEISVALQQRIFATATRAGDMSLLARLAAHPSLDASVDAQLKQVNAATVRAAWISRPGRRADEISELLNKEKRVTILSALAEHAGISQTVQRTLIEQTKNLSVLVALATNPNASDDSRHDAADRVVAHIAAPGGESLDAKAIGSVRTLRNSLPLWFETCAKTTDSLYVLTVAAESHVLDDEAQTRLIDGYLQVYSGELDRTPQNRYGYASPAQGEFSSLVSQLVESSELSDDNRRRLIEVVDKIVKRYPKENYARREFEHLLDVLKTSHSETYRTVYDRLALITSTEALEAFIIWFEQYRSNTKVNLSNQFVHSIATRVVASPLATPAHIESIEDWFAWGSLSELIKLTPDPRKQAALIHVQRFYADYDDVIDYVEDKSGFIEAVIDGAVTRGDTYAIASIMQNPMFAAENLRKVPLSMLCSLELLPEQNRMLSEMLSAAALDDQVWSVLESLSEEFEGSFDQLLELAGTI